MQTRRVAYMYNLESLASCSRARTSAIHVPPAAASSAVCVVAECSLV